MRNLIIDTIEATKDGIPAAIMGIDVMGLDYTYFEKPLSPAITGPPDFKDIHKNTSVAIMKNSYELFSSVV
jgi:hypothetical protein